MLGRIHFLESGELVYLTTAGDLLGRGIGQWIEGIEGIKGSGSVAFQLDIFQYEVGPIVGPIVGPDDWYILV